MAERRSVVKIKNSGCTGSTDNTLFAGSWTGSTSNDGCVVQFTELDDNAVTISAIALDGADNLWVCPAPHMPLLSVIATKTPPSPRCRPSDNSPHVGIWRFTALRSRAIVGLSLDPNKGINANVAVR